jgi:hypothetical protein
MCIRDSILPSKVFDLFYGAPGTQKSECARAVCEQVYRETGKRTRVVVGDGSALTYQHLVDAKIAEIAEFTHRSWPLDTLNKLTTGWWLKDPLDPNSELVAPNKAILDVGATVFEGLSVAGAYIMGNVRGGLANRGGLGEKMGQDSPIRIVEGELDPKTGQFLAGSGPGTTFGGNPIAHYGIGQGNIVGFVQQSRGLPSQVVIWTAHEYTNDPEKDSLVREIIAGPEVIGKKLVSNMQRAFNNTVHFQSVMLRKKSAEKDPFSQKAIDEAETEFRLYTRDHYNPNGAVQMRYKACTRGVGPDFPQFFTSRVPGQCVIDYYSALKDLRDKKSLDITAPAS